MRKLCVAALAAVGGWYALALLSVIFLLVEFLPNGQYQGGNGQYVYDHSGDLSPQARATIRDQCRRIYDRTSVRVVILITRNPDETLDSTADQGIDLLHQSTPNQFLNQLELNTPMIVVAFWERPGISMQQLYVPTVNAERLGITPDGLLKDKTAINTSLDQAVEATVADVGSDVTRGLLSRTWHGRVVSRTAIAMVWTACAFSLFFWIPALVLRALDGRAAPSAVAIEVFVGIAALVGVIQACNYFGGWPEAAGGFEPLARLAAAGLAVPLFVITAQRMNNSHLGRATFVLTLLSLTLITATMLYVWSSHNTSVLDRSSAIWRASPQMADNPLFQIFAFPGLLIFVLWALSLNALLVRLAFNALGEDSPFILGAIPERVILLDRALCLQTGKPLPLPVGTRPGLHRLIAETSFAYVLWVICWFVCLIGAKLVYKLLAKGPRHWPYCLRYDYAVRHCLPRAQELQRRGENRAGMRYASEALEVMHTLQDRCPLIGKSEAAFRSHMLIGELQLTQGKPEEARQALMAACATAKGVSILLELEALDRLGRFYWRMGDPSKAKISYEGALEVLRVLEALYVVDGLPMPFKQMARILRNQGPTARMPDVPGLLLPAMELWLFLESLEAEKAKTAYFIAECLEMLARNMEDVQQSFEWTHEAASFRRIAFAPPTNANSISGKLKSVLVSKIRDAGKLQPELIELCHPHNDTDDIARRPLEEGLTLLFRSAYLQALAAFRYAATLRPLDKRAHIAMGHAYELRGMPGPARQCYRQALALDDTCMPVRRGVVRMCLLLKDYPGAEQDLNRLLQTGAPSLEDQRLAGDYHRGIGGRRTKRRIGMGTAGERTVDSDGVRRHAKQLLNDGKREEAIQILWDALRNDPLDDDLWAMLAGISPRVTKDLLQRHREAEAAVKMDTDVRRPLQIGVKTVAAILESGSPTAAAAASLTSTDLLPLAQIAHMEGLRLTGGQPNVAKPLLLFALHAYNCLAKKDSIAEAYLGLAEVGRLLSQWDSARYLARFGLETAEEVGDDQLAASAHQSLAQSCRHAGDLEAATQHYAHAIAYQEEVRRHIVSIDSRSLFTANSASAYVGQVLTLLDLGRQEQALEYVERGKSREMIDLLGNHKLTLRSSAGREILERDERLQRNIAYLEADARELNWRLPGLRAEADQGRLNHNGQRELDQCQLDSEAISEKLNLARRELSAVKQQLRDSVEEWTSLRAVKPLPFVDAAQPSDLYRQITAMLGTQNDRTVILEYFISDEGTIIFLVPCWDGAPQRLTVARSSLSRITLDRIVHEDFRQTITKFGSPPVFLEELYKHLLAPVASQLKELGTETLLFAPHGNLHALPLHAMCYPDTQGRLRFLIEDYACAYVPSLSVLSLLQNKRQARGAGAFVAGNPTGDLDEAEDEAQSVARVFGTSAYLREEVTEARVKAEVVDKALIHLACHGHFERQDALQSHLTLADGVLQVDEVLDMSIRASLVTLSACSSGVSKISHGDELNGMARAWLYAGTSSVIASLWDVESTTTRQLMTAFYQNWREAGLPKARALQKAQTQWLERRRLTARRHPNEAEGLGRGWHESWHPARWSAFILVGDPL